MIKRFFDMIKIFLLIFLIIIPFVIIPIKGLILSESINTVIASFSIFIWLLLSLFGLLLLKVNTLIIRIVGLITMIIPSTLVGYISYNKIVIGNQQPFAFYAGFGFFIVVCIALGLIERQDGKNQPKRERTAKEIGKLLESHDNLAILGKPGAGKSTLTQFLALSFAQEKAGDRKYRKSGIVKERFGLKQWFLPIFIPLRKVSRYIVEADKKQEEDLLIEACIRRLNFDPPI